MNLDQADIVVVGGGIAGLATAHALNRRGYDVVLVEQRFLAFGASGRNSGGVWLQSMRSGAELSLAQNSLEALRHLEDELGPTFDYTASGGVFFYETEQQAQILADFAEDRRRLGLSAEKISADDARKMAPGVPESAIGAVYFADDAKLNTSKLVKGLGQLVRKLGVRIYENTPALSLIRSGNAVTGIRTMRGNIVAGGVVWCAGPWATNLDSEGVQLPLKLVRVGLLMTQPIRANLPAMTRGPLGARHLKPLTALPSYRDDAFSDPEPLPGKPGYEDVVVQGGEGNLYVGHTLDAANSLNPHITLESSRVMIDTILNRRPEYGELGVTGLWAGIVGSTPDELPIIDQVEGLYINTGHSAGAATGLYGGELMAQMVAGEDPGMPFEEFSLGRPSLNLGSNHLYATGSL
ncbi:FAD-binding oxidoreductase [Arthrobacter sp. M4]|uniref:NAD(P)/FAD-dependent oxidoreductase n=1 Tax=Arthrobacter sp. M4 TaxID=218160 RepID=UPI001CDD0668|nr:FAD-dependent oxidoreductase [Arthrobacter sp. M4]MCA4134816.1 FAD-binding oxidoreductase [Arthrobacter sp. M4]